MGLDLYQDDEYEGYVITQDKIRTLNLNSITGCDAGQLKSFPFCCGYAIYCDVYLPDIEKVTSKLKEILIENLEDRDGFGEILCTVVSDEYKDTLIKHGWELINTHINPGTGNTIYTLKLTV